MKPHVPGAIIGAIRAKAVETLADQHLIRNFSIIAHIDHGKSTLADRILELTGAISEREMEDQVLDQMDIERERGITIKARAVRMPYRASDGHVYEFNLIDTPGHVDFSYEVSRSLAACEGALLVIDATQGVEAQTIANLYLAMDHNLAIVPVINKIDLPSADPAKVRREIHDVLGYDPSGAIEVCAKDGTGVPEVLEAIVTRMPPPSGDRSQPLTALVFDSHFDSYKGVIAYVRVMDGVIQSKSRISMMSTGKLLEVQDVGVFTPAMEPSPELAPGEVGFISAGIRNVKDCRVGDTITSADNPASEPLPGYRRMKPMVFCGLYPAESSDYSRLREALEKLQLNDAALSFEPETSVALGFGFRCGFLGLLHMDVVQERLEREYDISMVTTAPSVVYRVLKTNAEMLEIDNPAELPPAGEIASIEEPFVHATIISPSTHVGAIMELARERRGSFGNMEYVSDSRVMLTYDLPLAEIMYDFFDQLKSRTRGYASLDYELSGWREGDLVRLDILVAGDAVDALSSIVHSGQAPLRARSLVERLRGLIPRHLFEVPIQAAIGAKIIARETVRAVRKDVLAKCYGGDVTRKRKLLEKQKEGKKRMKQVGRVEIPQEAFMAVLQVDRKDS